MISVRKAVIKDKVRTDYQILSVTTCYLVFVNDFHYVNKVFQPRLSPFPTAPFDLLKISLLDVFFRHSSEPWGFRLMSFISGISLHCHSSAQRR